jgi:oligoribonuclease NrnB/cAMP/cGMP phosphodiesterase (DHH superfamily)
MRICVWTDCDLDGAGSALLLKFFYKDRYTTFEIREVQKHRISDFVGEFKGWYKDIDWYDKVFITDLYVPHELTDLVDNEKFVIIDHHKSFVEEAKSRFQKAKTIVQQHTSTTDLIYTKFKIKDNVEFTDDLKLLVSTINDYDCYDLKVPNSISLNVVFNEYNYPRVEKFINDFKDGHRQFTINEQNAVKLFFKQLKDQLQTTEYYRGNIKSYSVVSCFCNFAINEMAHFTLKKYNADIVILVNTVTNQVYFRKAKGCTAALDVLANKLCGGGGQEYAAAGRITDTFLNYTKLLTPCS